MWIILEIEANILSDQCLNQEVEKYIFHAMPAGAAPVPINAEMGKREKGGYESFYQGWKQENPTRKNCRFGATREDLFPTEREVKLDVTFPQEDGTI
jgi:hypothetical protein